MTKPLHICGSHIKQLRLMHNLTLVNIQARLKEYGLEIDRTNLGRMESGQVTITDIELAVFVHLFEVPINSLLWGADPPPTKQELKEILSQARIRHASRRGQKEQKPPDLTAKIRGL